MNSQRVGDLNPTDSFGRPGQCILKVLYGKHQGTLKPLTSPVTLLGEDKGCDIRLNSPLIEQLQCVIVESPQGFLVRNLYDCDKIKINGEPVEQGFLNTGDELSIGPFSFLVQYAEPGLSSQSKLSPLDHLDDERQALRVQAAGVAAQHSAILEEEVKLLDNQKIFSEKEKQLGLHFQDKHLRQVQIQRNLKLRFLKLKQQETSITVLLKQQQDELLLQTNAANATQLRYVQLRNKLKSRWKIIARKQLNKVADIQKGIGLANAALEKETIRIQKERKSIANAQLLFDSQCDQERQKLSAAFAQLDEETQARSYKSEDREAAILQQENSLLLRESALAENQHILFLEQQLWQSYLAQLKFEEQGLERRILNLRDKLPAQNWPISTDTIPNPFLPLYNIPKDAPALMAELEGMASHLDDQRLRLLEAWHNIEQNKLDWEKQQQQVLAQLESAAKELDSKQYLLQNQERNCNIWDDQLSALSLDLSQQRKILVADKALFNSQLQTFTTEKVLLLQELELYKLTADHFSKMNQDSRRELLQIRLNDRLILQKDRDQLEEMRLACHSTWRDYQAKVLQLELQKQSLAIQELAISRLTLEVSNSPQIPRGERKLEKMRKNIEQRFLEEKKQISEARAFLQNEINSLNSLVQSSSLKDSNLELKIGDFERTLFEFDNQKADELQEKIKLFNSMKLLELKNLQFERRIEQLTLELEKLLAVVFDESSDAKVKVPGTIRLAA